MIRSRRLFLFALAGVPAAMSGASKAEAEVRAAMEAWRQAVLARDAAALGKMLHPNLAYSHSNTRNETRQDVLDSMKDLPIRAIEFSKMTVHVYGKTATVKCDAQFTTVADGQTTVVPLNILHVWVKGGGAYGGGGWQMTARQATRRP
jgi:ketosteroid isomerase-like protein